MAEERGRRKRRRRALRLPTKDSPYACTASVHLFTTSAPGANSVNNMTIDGTTSSDTAGRTSLSDAIISQQVGVEAAATGKEVGDLFEYRIDQPVTVRRDRSALIPILQTKMVGERVSIFNESVRGDRPLGGLLLKTHRRSRSKTAR